MSYLLKMYFRLKVHLPRNQLYVTRVSRNVLLEDIMKKVCEEKILDPAKYEFKHPGEENIFRIQSLTDIIVMNFINKMLFT